jgi:hypothetical protein
MQIIGTVTDIQPRAVKPTFELSFGRTDSRHLASAQKASVTLIIDGHIWRGTIRNDGTRDAYLHTRLTDDRGRTITCTELLCDLGIGHKGRIEFEVLGADSLRLCSILDQGSTHPSRNVGRERPVPRRARTQSAIDETSVVTSFPFGNCQELERLAVVYWDLITSKEASEERRFESDFAHARKQGFLSKELFVRVARWKSVRQTPNYESNSAEMIREQSAVAFQANDDGSALGALMQLRGVALRTASAILHWMRPDRFPILDVRVVSSLGLREPASYENVNFYVRIAAQVRELARECNLDLRTVDRALWAWDKLRASESR